LAAFSVFDIFCSKKSPRTSFGDAGDKGQSKDDQGGGEVVFPFILVLWWIGQRSVWPDVTVVLDRLSYVEFQVGIFFAFFLF